MDRLKIEQALLDMEVAEIPFSKDYLKRKMNGHDDKSVYDFWQSVINDRDGTLAHNTMRGYVAELSKLRQFRDTLYFSEVTLPFLEKYEAWMRSERGNNSSTVNKSMKRFHYTIERANKTIGTNCKAFDLYKKPTENTRTLVFDLEILDGMLEALYSGVFDKNVNETLAVFCLQALTGLRFGDASRFNKKEFVQGNNIIINTQKTNEPVYIPIVGRLERLLNFQNYMFGDVKIYNANRYLKGVGMYFKLPFPLSTHTAVHSFCTISLELGMTLEAIAKIRGHLNIRTTQIYTHVKNTYIEREMQKWDTPSTLKPVEMKEGA